MANVRLTAFNGINLAYLSKIADQNIRTLIYARPHDPVLAREAQRTNAFYERQIFLPSSLRGFLKAGLPTSDRRDARGIDRRTTFRGGRRTTDIAILHIAIAAT